MYRIILIDDEPLILAGIASLIYWESQDCRIVGKATNGHEAIDLILDLKPDIVITDIRMPVMNGLELIQACKDKNQEFAFIFLTNLEDFQLAKQAVHLGAIDYLVKLDLQPEALILALNKAKEHCSRMESHHNRELYTYLLQDSQEQLECSYFSRLLLHSGEAGIPADVRFPDKPGVSAESGLSDERKLSAEPGLSDDRNLSAEPRSFADEEILRRYPHAYLILFQMKPEQILFGQSEAYDFPFINRQLQDIVAGIARRYFSSHTALMPQKDVMLLVLSPKPESDNRKSLSDFCAKINVALSTYFALTALFGISRRHARLFELPQALEEAKAALNQCYYDSTSPIAFYQEDRPDEKLKYRSSPEREFNINFLKKSMLTAVQENDGQQLKNIFQELTELFAQYRPNKTQAVSACINIYTYLHDLLQNEMAESNQFPYSMDIARQLTLLGSLDDILAWLDSFCQSICSLLTDRKEKRSDRLVYLARRYIHEHYQEKLTLSDIADHLRISSGYLSTIFSRYKNQTVSDYIAEVKIQHAKELIDSGQYLIYEIADQLGFENAYYFSKVFKKVTGMSPKNYEALHRSDKL